jgi:hypothetical protein
MYAFKVPGLELDVNISKNKGDDLALAPKCVGERVKVIFDWGILEGTIRSVNDHDTMIFYRITTERLIDG